MMSSRVLVVAAASMVASTVTAGTPVVPLLTVVHDDCEHSPPERIRIRPGQTAELRVVLYDIIGGVAVPRAVQTLECDQPAQVVSAQPGFLEKTSGRKTTYRVPNTTDADLWCGVTARTAGGDYLYFVITESKPASCATVEGCYAGEAGCQGVQRARIVE